MSLHAAVRWLVLVVFIGVAALGAGGAPARALGVGGAVAWAPVAQGVGEPTPPDDPAAVMQGIQASLDGLSSALRSGDTSGALAYVDLKNLAFKRIIDGRIRDGWAPRGYTVTRVEPALSGYWKAFIDARGQATYVWFFHPVDGKWLLAEPSRAELGERRKRDTDHFTFDYFAWDEPLIDRIAAVAEQAYTRVTTKLGKEPNVVTSGKKVLARLAPTYEVNPGLFKENVLAAYPGSGGDQIWLRSPESFGGSVAGYSSDDRDMLVNIAHEFTHLMMDSFPWGTRIASWMNEGMAVYVSDGLDEWNGTLARAKRAGRLVDMDKLYQIMALQSERGFGDADIVLAYAEGGRAMQYLDQRFGFDKLLAWFDDYAKTRDQGQSAQNVFGVEWKQLQSDFLDWLNNQIAA